MKRIKAAVNTEWEWGKRIDTTVILTDTEGGYRCIKERKRMSA